MKHRVIMSLAVVAAGAGIALGQTPRPGAILVTEDPAPPPSVIRVENPKNNQRPAPAQAKAKPPQPKVQQATYVQEAPMELVRPDQPPPAPPTPKLVEQAPPKVDTPKAEMLPPPMPKDMPIKAVVGEACDDKSSYETNHFQPIFPWTKCGHRACGTVYVETPYFWFDTRYLFGWFKKDRTQPLVTSGPVGSAFPGTLDDPRTTVLYDGQRLHDQPYMGGQFAFGAWFDECQYCGGELEYFFFASQDTGSSATANGFPGTPGLYQPFFNPLTGAEDVFTVAQPGDASGIIRITSRSDVNAAGGHFLFSFCRGMTFRCDALAGVRWLGLSEDLTMESNVRQFGTPNRLPNDVGILDHFGTRTDFIGGDFGFKSHWVNNCWSWDLLTRVAIGGNHQIIRGDGFTGVTQFGFPTQFVHLGRYIGPANSGVFGNDTFAVVPEVGISVAYQPTCWFKLKLGYNWMYWTNVIRPGAQVDRVINPIGVPTRREFQSDIYEPQRPGVAFNQTDIWLQAITLGVEFTF